MDYLDEPGGRQRAMSVASILTNTMEGSDPYIFSCLELHAMTSYCSSGENYETAYTV